MQHESLVQHSMDKRRIPQGRLVATGKQLHDLSGDQVEITSPMFKRDPAAGSAFQATLVLETSCKTRSPLGRG